MRTQPSILILVTVLVTALMVTALMVTALMVTALMVTALMVLTVTEKATIPLMVVLSTLAMVLSTRETALMSTRETALMSTREKALLAIPMVESTWMAFAVQQTLVLSKATFNNHNISMRVSIAIHAEQEHAASTNTVFAGPSDILLMVSKDVWRKGTHSYYAHLIYASFIDYVR
jgi:hypothetical protein